MKKITLLFFLLLGFNAISQQLYVEGGKSLSSFEYKNSNGNSLDNLHASSQSFMAIGYRNKFLVNNLYGTLGMSYAGYGAIGSDNVLGNFFEWNVNYLEFNLGLDYEFIKINKTKIYMRGMASLDFLVQGTQTLNNMVVDMKDNDDFDKVLVDFRGGLGVSHIISDQLSFYAQFMYGRSIKMKNSSPNNNGQEELRIISKNLSFGLLFNISKKNNINLNNI